MITTNDPRVLQHAIMGVSGVRQNEPGTVIEYWRGPADFEPTSKRKDIFSMAYKMYEAGLCHLCQYAVGQIDDQPNGKVFEWSYRAVVR